MGNGVLVLMWRRIGMANFERLGQFYRQMDVDTANERTANISSLPSDVSDYQADKTRDRGRPKRQHQTSETPNLLTE